MTQNKTTFLKILPAFCHMMFQTRTAEDLLALAAMSPVLKGLGLRECEEGDFAVKAIVIIDDKEVEKGLNSSIFLQLCIFTNLPVNELIPQIPYEKLDHHFDNIQITEQAILLGNNVFSNLSHHFASALIDFECNLLSSFEPHSPKPRESYN
jgi:hypothetical protein